MTYRDLLTGAPCILTRVAAPTKVLERRRLHQAEANLEELLHAQQLLGAICCSSCQ